MKKFIGVIFLIFLLAGCNAQADAGLQPPNPTITIDGVKANYATGSYAWTNGGQQVIADAGEPPELVHMANITGQDATIRIRFPYQPDVILEGVWTEGMHQINHDEVQLPAKKEDYIYMIHAKWPEGDAYYFLKIKMQK